MAIIVAFSAAAINIGHLKIGQFQLGGRHLCSRHAGQNGGQQCRIHCNAVKGGIVGSDVKGMGIFYHFLHGCKVLLLVRRARDQQVSSKFGSMRAGAKNGEGLGVACSALVFDAINDELPMPSAQVCACVVQVRFTASAVQL